MISSLVTPASPHGRSNTSGSPAISASKGVHPSRSPATMIASRMDGASGSASSTWPSTYSSATHTMAFTSALCARYTMSLRVSCSEAGMTVAPSFASATAITQYSQRRRKMHMTTSPLPMPRRASALAALFDSAAMSANVNRRSSPASSIHKSARLSGSTRAHSSTTSNPKLNASGTSMRKLSRKSSYESNSMRGRYLFST